MMKLFFILLSFLPLGVHFPYLLQAWDSSRLDRWDWIFFLAFIPAAFWALRNEKSGKWDFWALGVLLPMLVLTFCPQLHHINAISIASAVGVIFGTVWLVGSWSFGWKFLPAAIVLLLGTPSSSYQLSLLLMCPVWAAWGVKFIAALLSFVWIFCNGRFNWQLKKGTLFFTAALLGSGFLLLHSRELYFEGRGFVPEFPGRVAGYWGRSIEPDENTKRFFVSSSVKQFRYAKEEFDISVLAVKCGRDIHEIHPASHCLRTSQWNVDSETILYLNEKFAVTEIEARKGRNAILVWVWYSSEEFSVPGFLGFRRHFRPGGNYWTYQISIPLCENTGKSRQELKKFVQALRSKKQL